MDIGSVACLFVRDFGWQFDFFLARCPGCGNWTGVWLVVWDLNLNFVVVATGFCEDKRGGF